MSFCKKDVSTDNFQRFQNRPNQHNYACCLRVMLKAQGKTIFQIPGIWFEGTDLIKSSKTGLIIRLYRYSIKVTTPYRHFVHVLYAKLGLFLLRRNRFSSIGILPTALCCLRSDLGFHNMFACREEPAALCVTSPQLLSILLEACTAISLPATFVHLT